MRAAKNRLRDHTKLGNFHFLKMCEAAKLADDDGLVSLTVAGWQSVLGYSGENAVNNVMGFLSEVSNQRELLLLDTPGDDYVVMIVTGLSADECAEVLRRRFDHFSPQAMKEALMSAFDAVAARDAVAATFPDDAAALGVAPQIDSHSEGRFLEHRGDGLDWERDVINDIERARSELKIEPIELTGDPTLEAAMEQTMREIDQEMALSILKGTDNPYISDDYRRRITEACGGQGIRALMEPRHVEEVEEDEREARNQELLALALKEGGMSGYISEVHNQRRRRWMDDQRAPLNGPEDDVRASGINAEAQPIGAARRAAARLLGRTEELKRRHFYGDWTGADELYPEFDAEQHVITQRELVVGHIPEGAMILRRSGEAENAPTHYSRRQHFAATISSDNWLASLSALVTVARHRRRNEGTTALHVNFQDSPAGRVTEHHFGISELRCEPTVNGSARVRMVRRSSISKYTDPAVLTPRELDEAIEALIELRLELARQTGC